MAEEKAFKLVDQYGNPFKIEREKKSTRRELSSELGSGGVSFFNGIIDNDEENKLWTGTNAVATADKMRRTDSQVGAVFNAVNLPILSAEWTVTRPEEEEEADKISDDHIDFANKNLFTKLNFTNTLRHALSSLWAGFAWFEKVYEPADGFLELKKLAPRLASTVDKWWTDDRGELIGLEQDVRQEGRNKRIDIPRDKIALFTFQQEANNFEGQSLLRPVYRNWLIKDTLYRVDAIRAERFAIGVPVVTLPDNFNQKQEDQAVLIGKNWRGSETAYAVISGNMKIEIVQAQSGSSLDLIPSIKHHNEQIGKILLTQFLSLGETATGSRALGESSTAFFIDALHGIANWIAETIEREILWPLMDLNFAGKIRPRVLVDDLGAVSLEELRDTLKDLREYITPTIDIENTIRDRVGLEPIDEADSKLGEEDDSDGDDDPPAPTQPEEPEEIETKQVRLKKKEFSRALTAEEEHVQFRQLDGKLDDTQDRVMRVLLNARDQWVDELRLKMSESIAGGPQRIDRVRLGVSSQVQLSQDIGAELIDTFDFGADQVERELRSQAKAAGVSLKSQKTRKATIFSQWTKHVFRDEEIDLSEADQLMFLRGAQLVEKLSRKTEENSKELAIGIWRTRGSDFSTVDLDDLADNLSASVEQDARLLVALGASEALSLGRDFTAGRMQNNILNAQYSAILDGGTCVPCNRADGFIVEYGTSDYYETMPPLQSGRFGMCNGYSRCRCLYIYKLDV